jgi:superfamily II DNA or RNA helicase/HKD family nuclease
MDELRDILAKSIETGFIDIHVPSDKAYHPEIITNDPTKHRKVLTTIIRELEQCDEFWFSVAFITTSGVATLINTFIELEKKNVKGKILASQYLTFTQPEALKRIRQFSNIELRMATQGDFHAKGYLFRKGNLFNLIIGSSNLTQSALCTNKEWNLKVSATQESELIDKTKREFQAEFEKSVVVTDEFLAQYLTYYDHASAFKAKQHEWSGVTDIRPVTPNLMQREALDNLHALREAGHKKALLISATGTGKTYLSAFDVQRFKPKRFLFVVHRRTIAEKSRNTFMTLMGGDVQMAMYSGDPDEADFLFATVQTISKTKHLKRFARDHFDYIVIDETHRAGAKSYLRLLNYFTPKFIMGMTATPERTDGLDVFELFDHNIAYEIRLHRALSEGMLSPFHYYGVTDLTVDGEEVDAHTSFHLLEADERVNRIIEKLVLYGSDSGTVRGLIFCSRTDECELLSVQFNLRGYRTIALTGASKEKERRDAIRRLETEDMFNKLDYVFTVDIFNEGVDIPKINQIVMLRPTQSAIIFVQQLGRGLRKIGAKEYLTVIDFIGNYNNNYLVPIALYGDVSYNKDTLRKLISSGSRLIPGESTINFDRITKQKIFEAIDSANMTLKRDLVKDYALLKYKLGHMPMMMDFVEHGSRDPKLFADYSKSYFNFAASQESELAKELSSAQRKLLEVFSNEINNAKRVEESLMLEELMQNGFVDLKEFKSRIKQRYDYEVTQSTIDSCIVNLNFEFTREKRNSSLRTIAEIHGFRTLKVQGDRLVIDPDFAHQLKNEVFSRFLADSTKYSIQAFEESYDPGHYDDGFILYKKYARKDTFRLLNWAQNPVAQNVGGYMISNDKANCPIFVNYHKAEDISSTTKYDDAFISPFRFKWMSKSRRTLKSNDVKTIRSGKARLPLFVKKSNDEGKEFYYMGDLQPIDESFEQVTMETDSGRPVSVVKVEFGMETAVEEEVYRYITEV